jgi:hypothetical protein
MKITYGDAKVEEHIMLTRAQWQAIDARERSDGASDSCGKKEDSHLTKKSGNKGKKPKKKFDKKNLRCHKCNQLGHFKSECRNASAEKALMAREEDDGPMMMMLEVCEQSDVESHLHRGRLRRSSSSRKRRFFFMIGRGIWLHTYGTSTQALATT